MNYFTYTQEELEALKAKDKRLREAIERIGWIEREVNDDLFEALISSIVGQQISSKAAKTVWHKLCNALGSITPERVFQASAQTIQSCGMSMRKAMYIKDMGDKVMLGELDLKVLPLMDDDSIIATLTTLKGIGTWTAQMLLIFCLQRKNVISWDDLAIRRGMMRLYRHKTLTKVQFARYAKRYSPYASIASLYLWKLSE